MIFCHTPDIKAQNVTMLSLVTTLYNRFFPCLVIIITYFYLYMIIDWKFFQQTKFISKNNNTLLIKQYNKRFLKTRAVMQRFSPLVTIAI